MPLTSLHAMKIFHRVTDVSTAALCRVFRSVKPTSGLFPCSPSPVIPLEFNLDLQLFI